MTGTTQTTQPLPFSTGCYLHERIPFVQPHLIGYGYISYKMVFFGGCTNFFFFTTGHIDMGVTGITGIAASSQQKIWLFLPLLFTPLSLSLHRISAPCLHQSHGYLHTVWPLRLSHQEGRYVKLLPLPPSLLWDVGEKILCDILLFPGRWVIFNDEKVAESAAPPLGHAYLYFYKRVANESN